MGNSCCSNFTNVAGKQEKNNLHPLEFNRINSLHESFRSRTSYVKQATGRSLSSLSSSFYSRQRSPNNILEVGILPRELLVHIFTWLPVHAIARSCMLVCQEWYWILKSSSCFLNLKYYPTISLQIVANQVDMQVWRDELPFLFDSQLGIYLDNVDDDKIPYAAVEVVGEGQRTRSELTDDNSIPQDIIQIPFHRATFFSAAYSVTGGASWKDYTLLQPHNMVVYQHGRTLAFSEEALLSQKKKDIFSADCKEQMNHFVNTLVTSSLKEKRMWIPHSILPTYQKLVVPGYEHLVELILHLIENQIRIHGSVSSPWMLHNLKVFLDDIAFYRIDPIRLFKCLPKDMRKEYIEQKLLADMESTRFYMWERYSSRTNFIAKQRVKFISCFLFASSWVDYTVPTSIVFPDETPEPLPEDVSNIFVNNSFFASLVHSGVAAKIVVKMVSHLLWNNKFETGLIPIIISKIDESSDKKNKRRRYMAKLLRTILLTATPYQEAVFDDFLQMYLRRDKTIATQKVVMKILREGANNPIISSRCRRNGISLYS